LRSRFLHFPRIGFQVAGEETELYTGTNQSRYAVKVNFDDGGIIVVLPIIIIVVIVILLCSTRW
jgi:hypothetical protein